MYKFSIVIPVYNVEKYLKECLKSLQTQTYAKFEVILVDDGSQDKSGEICDEFAKHDKRFMVFHKSNGGVSSARNYALDRITGDYVKFVDADDVLSSECLSDMADILERYKWDMIEHTWYIFREDGTIINQSHFDEDCSLKAGENKSKVYAQLFNSYKLGSLCTKVIDAKFFNGEVASIRLDTSMSHVEDQVASAQIYDLCSSVKFIDKPYYGYRAWNASSTKKFNANRKDDIKKMLLNLDMIWAKFCHTPEESQNYQARKLNNIVTEIMLVPSYINATKQQKIKYIKSMVNDGYFHQIIKQKNKDLTWKRKIVRWLLAKKMVNIVYLICFLNHKMLKS